MAIIGSEIIRLTEVDSTNRFLMDWLANEKPAEGTLVISDFQTAGRGTDGSMWESEAGCNLTFSFVLYPSFLALDAQFCLNKIISLGLADFISEVLPGRDDVRIKWPNDIYIGNQKVAGTLIQNGIKGSRFAYSIIGIGLNINQENFSKEAANPVSLKMLAGTAFNLDEMLERTVSKIDQRYNLLKQGAIKKIDEDYLKLLYRVKEFSGYIYKGKPIRAMITGINQYGQLKLEVNGGEIIECDLKEIKFETKN
jgi:BirA family biotin operon repressor/biotin-[acetyl-CoA-carboxylase] ligase